MQTRLSDPGSMWKERMTLFHSPCPSALSGCLLSLPTVALYPGGELFEASSTCRKVNLIFDVCFERCQKPLYQFLQNLV